MQLPVNASAIADAFKELTKERKAQIIAHLAQTPDARANETITTLINNGGPEGRFVGAIFGKQPPGKGASPMNKAIGPVESK